MSHASIASHADAVVPSQLIPVSRESPALLERAGRIAHRVPLALAVELLVHGDCAPDAVVASQVAAVVVEEAVDRHLDEAVATVIALVGLHMIGVVRLRALAVAVARERDVEVPGRGDGAGQDDREGGKLGDGKHLRWLG